MIIRDNRSVKIKVLDFIFNGSCRSDYLKSRLKVIADRALLAHDRFKFSYDTSENGEYEFIKHLALLYGSSDFIFFDVGAHHGTYTNLILNLFKTYEGHLFEPTPASFSKLVERFSLDNNLTLNNSALSNFRGNNDFIIYPSDPTRNGLTGVGREINFISETLKIDVTKGDFYLKEKKIERINLLKIDAEGHDFKVLQGFSEYISNELIDVIQFEYTFKHADMRITLRDYYEFFNDNSYSIGPLRKHGIDFYNNFDARYNEYHFGPNFVAVRKNIMSDFLLFNNG